MTNTLHLVCLNSKDHQSHIFLTAWQHHQTGSLFFMV